MHDGAHGSRRRGQYAKTEPTRQAVLDAAVDVFSASGFRGGSLREVAAAAGLSQAGLLHHYPTKVALLIAVLERRDERTREFLRADLDAGPISLQQLVAVAQWNETAPALIKLYCTLAGEATTPSHPAHAYFRRRYESARSMMAEALERAKAEGSIDADLDVTHSALRAIALWDGLQTQWLHDPSGTDVACELQSHFAHLAPSSETRSTTTAQPIRE